MQATWGFAISLQLASLEMDLNIYM